MNLISIAGADGWWVEGDGDPVRVAAWGMTDKHRVVPLTAGQEGKLEYLDRPGVRLAHYDAPIDEVLDAVDRAASGIRESVGAVADALGRLDEVVQGLHRLDGVVRSLSRLKGIGESLERLEELVAALAPADEEEDADG